MNEKDAARYAGLGLAVLGILDMEYVGGTADDEETLELIRREAVERGFRPNV